MSDIQQLTDRNEVTDLVHRMSRWLDGRGGDPTTIYDAAFVGRSPRGEIRGIEHALRVASPSLDPTERTNHRVTDLLIELDGDLARVEANQLVHFFRPGEPPYRTSGLRLTYTLTRRPSGWRLTEADIQLEWLEGEPIAVRA